MEPIVKFPLIDKMEFIDDPQMKRLAKFFPKIQKKEIRPYVKLTLEEMQGENSNRLDAIASNPSSRYHLLAVRHLLRLLHREAINTDPQELREYLESLKLSAECCDELASILNNKSVFEDIPQSVRLRPQMVRLRWKIDISYCQRSHGDSVDESLDQATRDSLLRNRIQVILLIEFSDQSKRVISLSLPALERFRLGLCDAIRNVKTTEARFLRSQSSSGENA